MKNSIKLKVTTALVVTACFIAACMSEARSANKEAEPLGPDNLAYKWAELILEATAFDTERFNPRPTITSRYLGLIFTSVFDAWSRYDEKAIPVYLQNVQRQPSS